MKRLVGLLGWLGVVLVVAALAMRFAHARDLQQWYRGLALAGLVVTALYALSQWRDIGRSFQGRNVQVRIDRRSAASLIFLAILVGINWIANRQNKRWDLTDGRAVLAVRPDEADPRDAAEAAGDEGVLRRAKDSSSGSAISSASTATPRRSSARSSTSTPTKIRCRRKSLDVQTVPTIVIEYDGRTERTTSTDEQGSTNALKKAARGQGQEDLLRCRATASTTPTAADPEGYSGDRRGAQERQLRGRASWRSRRIRQGAGRRDGRRRRRADRPTSCRRRSTASRRTWTRAASCC